jgi:thioredoxin 1
VFFMNPNGMPCQMQDRVIRDMASELNGRAQLVYYRTTDPADLGQFERYGIRALPMLVLTDASGREIRRATPGIQSADQIRRLLAP